MPIYHYGQSCSNPDKEFEVAKEGKRRVDVTFFTVAKSKAEAVRKFTKTPSIGNSSIRWVYRRTDDSGNEHIAKTIQDDAIYAFEMTSLVLIGRYHADTYGWIAQPDYLEKLKQWREQLDKERKKAEANEPRTQEEIEQTVLNYLRTNYYQSLDRNGQLSFQNSVMYALRVKDQEHPDVLRFWEKAKRSWLKK